ncbi:MAG: hypothetical protein RL768_2838 [Nitrospirota bacterium]|jgi:hypothetical protein
MAEPFQKATYMKLQMIVFGLITGLLSCFLVHAQTTLMTNGLVAYYPFDNDIYDHSGNGKHSSYIQVEPRINFVRDRFGNEGKALYIDGKKKRFTS